MSSFHCDQCDIDIIDKNGYYITGCEHWPLEDQNQADAFNEKAGMLEFENGLSTNIAEKMAIHLIKEFYEPNK